MWGLYMRQSSHEISDVEFEGVSLRYCYRLHRTRRDIK